METPIPATTLMETNCIVKHYAGSIAYGTNIATSDTDVRGIFVANPINVRTPFFRIEESVDNNEEDTKLYELFQFMKLALNCNPNVIETLWVDRQDIIAATPAYELLRQNAGNLLSSKIADTTCGYAFSQLKRIKGHNKWINNPQTVNPPTHKPYISLIHNFTDEKLFKFDADEYNDGYQFVPYGNHMYGVYVSPNRKLFNSIGHIIADNADRSNVDHDQLKFIVKFNENEYEIAKNTWSQYWDWKHNRNEVRSKLEEQHGYDTKHAMHLVRLLRMGKEALSEGKIIVKRPDAEELLAIRNGKWTYQEILEYADDVNNEINQLKKTTHLPKHVDLVFAANLCMDIQDLVWSKE